MNMNWWNIIKSTPRSRREKKEQQKWLEDFKNEVNQKHKFTEPDGLNDTTDAYGYALRSGNYGEVLNEGQLAERRHKLGLEHDFDNQQRMFGDRVDQRRDRVRAITDSQLPKEHGVARRNMSLTDTTHRGGASDEPLRSRKFDEQAGSEQPTLDVEHSQSKHHRPDGDDGSPGWVEDIDTQGVDNSDRHHPLDPQYWRYKYELEPPNEAQTAIDTQNQREKDNYEKEHWADREFGEKREWQN